MKVVFIDGEEHGKETSWHNNAFVGEPVRVPYPTMPKLTPYIGPVYYGGKNVGKPISLDPMRHSVYIIVEICGKVGYAKFSHVLGFES